MAGQSCLHSTSSHWRSTTEESFTPKGSADADPVDYSEMHVGHGASEPPSKEQQETLPVLTSLRKGPSPVKAPAAYFERMHYHVAGEYIHDRPRITTSTVRSIWKRLEMKDSAPKPVHTPPIELALPQLIGLPRRECRQSSESGHSDTFQCDAAGQPIATNSPNTHPTRDRKVSIPWPFKWNPFP